MFPELLVELRKIHIERGMAKGALGRGRQRAREQKATVLVVDQQKGRLDVVCGLAERPRAFVERTGEQRHGIEAHVVRVDPEEVQDVLAKRRQV